MARTNQHGQPVGDLVSWSGARSPAPVVLTGRLAVLRPLTEEDAPAVLTVLGAHDDLWTYQGTDAPRTVPEAETTIRAALDAPDTVPFAVESPDSAFLGRVHLMRAQPGVGSIEVGAIIWSPSLQRTPAATEVQYLLARHVLEDLGYRRYEWKCDSLNAPSRSAALRLGFTEEGTWRNALVTKGRNRDTTWFAMTDTDWPRVRTAFEAWLGEDNHDPEGRQRRSLAELRAALP